MPKIPRDISASKLIAGLKRYGYAVSRQTGSHIRLSSSHKQHEHKITIPNHSPIKIGTLNSILGSIADYLELSKDDLINEIF